MGWWEQSSNGSDSWAPSEEEIAAATREIQQSKAFRLRVRAEERLIIRFYERPAVSFSRGGFEYLGGGAWRRSPFVSQQHDHGSY